MLATPLATRRLLSLLGLLALVAAGCGPGGAANSGPFGPARGSSLLAPFAGQWTCDVERTLAGFKAAGATDENLEELRKAHHQNPQLGEIHPDLHIAGDVAVSPGPLSAEYRFFAMHQHSDKVCGNAWHHEDRFDPGDMTKCYVRLWVKDGLLYMDLRMQEASPELDDPELLSMPAPEGGTAAQCDADKPASSGWGEWTTYVFQRKAP